MKVYIDQSGKFENTKKLTVVAYFGTISKSLVISATEKRKLIKILKITAERRKFILYEIFATLVYILLKDEKIDEVVVDNEYVGHEGTIKNFIRKYYLKYKKQLPLIYFSLITKKNPAHKIAIDTYRGNRRPDLRIKAIDVLKYLF